MLGCAGTVWAMASGVTLPPVQAGFAWMRHCVFLSTNNAAVSTKSLSLRASSFSSCLMRLASAFILEEETGSYDVY